MRPIARLRTELTVSGVGQTVLGVLGLLAALAAGADLGRAVGPFVLFAAALVGLQASSSFVWIRRGAQEAVPPVPDARIESTTDTIRRGAVALTLPVAAILLVALVDVELTAWVAGVPFGVGIADGGSAIWVARREPRIGALYRELGRTPFAGARRRVYTVPRRAITLET